MELKITAARGYSIDDEEIVMGVRCVGAPMVDTQGKVRGAISVAGPTWRLTRERVELLGPEVADAARRMGAQLKDNLTLADDPRNGSWMRPSAPCRACQARVSAAAPLAPACQWTARTGSDCD